MTKGTIDRHSIKDDVCDELEKKKNPTSKNLRLMGSFPTFKTLVEMCVHAICDLINEITQAREPVKVGSSAIFSHDPLIISN